MGLCEQDRGYYRNPAWTGPRRRSGGRWRSEMEERWVVDVDNLGGSSSSSASTRSPNAYISDGATDLAAHVFSGVRRGGNCEVYQDGVSGAPAVTSGTPASGTNTPQLATGF